MAEATRLSRLQDHWVYGGFLAGLLLLALIPLLAADWPTGNLLGLLLLPAYMLHQYEEHDNDRFRRFVNRQSGAAHEALSRADVFVINIAGVWAVLAGALWLQQKVAPGWGLIGAALVLVNGLAHVLQALARRRGNPGLLTAVGLFLPLGLGCAVTLGAQATAFQALAALALALVLHAAILARIRLRTGRAEP
jgi:hypothetical protein